MTQQKLLEKLEIAFSTHFIIHVPHHIHKHHHTLVKKIYIPVKSHDDHHGHEHEEYGW